MENLDKNTRPETPTIDEDLSITKGDDPAVTSAEKSVADRLSGKDVKVEDEKSNAPVAKKTEIIDLNNMTPEQVQRLQDLMAETPRRVVKKETYHTIKLRKISDKVIVEWGDSYFDLKHDSTQRKDVMKTMIPVRFHGEDKFVDILWSEEFMTADKVVCKILKMDKEDVAEVVGTTLKRDKDGGQTSQEVEMYVNKVVIILTVQLPNGEEAVLNGKFAN